MPVVFAEFTVFRRGLKFLLIQAMECVKLPRGPKKFPVLPNWEHVAEPVTQEPVIFYDDGIRLDFYDPQGGEIAKDIFNIA